MDYDEEKVDEAVIALLYLTLHEDFGGKRAWKGHDVAALERLHEKGLISNPHGKARSVILTDEGEAAAEEAFLKLFALGGEA